MSNETDNQDNKERSPISELLMKAAINAKPLVKVQPLFSGYLIPIMAGFLFAIPCYLFMQDESFVAIAGAFLALPWFLYSTVAEHHACRAINALVMDEAIRESMLDALMERADNPEVTDEGTSDSE